MKSLEEMIKCHEGSKQFPYTCTAGKLTIGYGRNLTDKGLSQSEMEYLLHNDILDAESDIDKIFDYYVVSTLPKVVYIALVDMMFNLGLNRFMGFKRMIAAICEENWELTAEEMLDSKWAKQVGQRAIELAEMVRNGGVRPR